MDPGSIDKALERIESALARIEGAVARRDSDDAGLRSRHENLKAAVNQSLAQLDKLIDGQRR
jgi:hypothetical protein